MHEFHSADMKRCSQTRVNGRIKRIYDLPRTPYQQV